ncbi:MAG: LON peptidase substrate-binding domain-containing protein [Verrucomicrobia bacterium]|nr:LON peptidase substrate-binding domain-containing protein [Verrucomicrobiota bacterium]
MNLPREVPVMTLPNAILFPQAMLPLHIFEPRYRRMLEDVLASHRMFSVAMRKPNTSRETPCNVAGLGLVRASVQNKDGTSHLIVQGIVRVRFGATVQRKPYRVVRIEPLEPKDDDSVVVDALIEKVRELVADRIARLPDVKLPMVKSGGSTGKGAQVSLFPLKSFARQLAKVRHPDQIADMVACTLLRNPLQRQLILETVRADLRLKHLIHFLIADERDSGKGGFNE